MREKNIVYLLGAGASANCLPVDKDLNIRMRFFLTLMKDLHGEDKFKEYEELLNEIDKKSPDLMAKTWSHNSALNSHRLLLLKNFMSSFFIFEQLKKNESTYTGRLLNAGIGDADDQRIFKTLPTTLDIRYQYLVASICKKDEHGNVVLPSNVSIISWNNDLQIERAYQEITGDCLSEAQEKLNVYPAVKKEQKNNFNEAVNNSLILKLNGTAWFFSDTSKGENLFDPLKHTFEGSHDLLYDNLIHFKYHNLLYFAGDDSGLITSVRKAALEKMKRADYVVVIGYSFPPFNKEKDNELLRCLLENRSTPKIYIQDTNAKKVKERLTFCYQPIKDMEERDFGDHSPLKMYEAEADRFLTPDELIN